VHEGAHFRPLLDADALRIRTADADIGVASVSKRSFSEKYMLLKIAQQSADLLCPRLDR
jgi:hypothetical protein